MGYVSGHLHNGRCTTLVQVMSWHSLCMAYDAFMAAPKKSLGQHFLSDRNILGAIAEEQGHHPDLALAWGKVGVEIWTHKVDGLTESDFVLAAKAERAFRALAG